MARLPIQPLNAARASLQAACRALFARCRGGSDGCAGLVWRGPVGAQGQPQTKSVGVCALGAHRRGAVRRDPRLGYQPYAQLDVAMHFTVGGARAGGAGAARVESRALRAALVRPARVALHTGMMDGTPLSWRQLDFQTWELEGTKPGGKVTVEFKYLADTIDRAVAWTRPDFGFFNGTNVFMYPVGHGFDWPAKVTIHTDPGWNIATAKANLIINLC